MKKKIDFIEFFVIIILSGIVFFTAGQYDLFERLVVFTAKHEDWELDEFIVVAIFWVFATTYFLIQKVRLNNKINSELEESNNELQQAIEKINQLQGIVPICASCKNIRDDGGFWHQVEVYVQEHSQAQFTHGICPDCAQKLYPDILSTDFSER